jgi:alpha-2-macroglobulin-like protein
MSTPNDHVENLIDDYLYQLLTADETLRVARHCDDCSSCMAALVATRRRLEAVRAAVPPLPEVLLQATLQRVEAADRRQRRLRRRVVASVAGGLAAAAMLLAGLQWYFETLRATPYDLVVLGQRTLLAAAPASVRVRLINRATGTAMAGVPVTVELIGNAAGKTELARFDTDADGSARPRFQLPEWADGDYRLRVTAATPGGPEVIDEPVKLRRSWNVMLSSDKPVYQPGQTIHLRAMTLRRPDLHPVAGESAVFTVSDPRGNVIFKHSRPTSKHGIASADCELAGEIADGNYAVSCTVGNTSSKLVAEVKRYVLPKFKLDVRTDKPFYAPGDTARLTVQTDYFFGKSVIDATVEAEMRTAGSESAAVKQTGRTDAKGNVTLSFALPKVENDARVTFLVNATDTAGQSRTRETGRIISMNPLHIDVVPEGGTLVPGIPNRVYLVTTYADGSPARTKVMASGIPGVFKTDEQGVTSLEYTPKAPWMIWKLRAIDDKGVTAVSEKTQSCKEQWLDFLVRTDRAIYDSGSTIQLTALGNGSQPVFVDILKDDQTVLTETIDVKDGRGSQAFDLPPELFGTLRLSAYRVDDGGNLRRKTRVLYVRPASQLTVKAVFPGVEFRPGRHTRLDLRLTDAHGNPTPGAISLAAVDESVFSVLQRAPGNELGYYTIDQELLRPADWLRTQSADESLTAGYERLAEALLAATTVTEETDNLSGMRSSHTLSAVSFPRKRLNVEGSRHSSLNVVKVGWVVLVLALIVSIFLKIRPYFSTTTQLISVISGCFAVVLVITSNEELRRGMELTSVQKSPASSGENMALAEEPLQLRQGQGPTDYFTIWGMASRAFDNSVMLTVDQNPNDGGPGFGALAFPLPYMKPTLALNPTLAPRIRELFPETLLWRPEIVTDDEGRASLDIDLADSITTWRFLASAISADGRLGAAQEPLKVFQPFFVDVNLPVSLTRGDEVAVPVVVSNYLDKPQTITLTLADAPWCERLGNAEKRLDLAAGEVRSVNYVLRARLAGSHTLQVSARGGSVADAVKRNVEVVPDGRRIERVVNGTLALPASIDLVVPDNAVPGSVKAVVKLYPSSFSQLIEGLDGIFRMPSGCFEQTSSTTYPNVLALDYLRRTGQARPEIEAKARHYVHLGYQRLLGFEIPTGGFDWFGNPPANRTLTAYGLMEFEDMARVHDVDPQLIARTRNWLLAQRRGDGSWQPEGHFPLDAAADVANENLQTLATTAYIARAVFGGDYHEQRAPTRDFILTYKPEAIDDPHALALTADALLALDARDEAVSYLHRLDALKKVSGDDSQVWWEQAAGRRTTFFGSGRGGSVETTALATLALLHGQLHPKTSQRAIAWLVAQRDAAGTWPTTQATVLSLKALLAGTNLHLSNRERRIEVRLGDNFRREIVVPADQAEVMQQLDLAPHLGHGTARLTLTETTDSAAGFQVAFRYHVPEASESMKEGPLAIDVAYDRTELAVGETVKATATAANRAAEPAAMVMVDLPVPAGFVPVTDDFATLVQAGKVAKYQVQPRVVMVYLRDLKPGTPLILKYRLKAITPAKVAAPAARVYEYYDPDRQGRSAEVRFTVKNAGASSP